MFRVRVPSHRSPNLPTLELSNLLTSPAEILAEPGQLPGQHIYAVFGWAAGDEAVGAAGVADEFGLAADLHQCGEELFSLVQRAAIIGLAVDDQGWGADGVRAG